MQEDGRVERDEAVEERLAAERDDVAAHGHQQSRVGEHHGGGGAARHRHSVAGDPAQTGVLALHRVVWRQPRDTRLSAGARRGIGPCQLVQDAG